MAWISYPFASLAAFALWLIGTAAVERKLDRHLRPGSPQRPVYSRIFLARLLLTLEDYRPFLDGLSDPFTNTSQCAAEQYDLLFAEPPPEA